MPRLSVCVRDIMRARQPLPGPGHHLNHAGTRRRLLLRHTVSVERAIGGVLARLSDAQVEALAAKCHGCARPQGGLGDVVTGAAPGAHDAVTALSSAWSSQATLTGDGVALALRVGLHARRDAEARR